MTTGLSATSVGSEANTAGLKANTAWMLAGRLVRIGVQALYFVLLARSLGVLQYGAFVAAAGLAGILAPFASLGTGNLLIKHVARDPRAFRRSWAQALAATAVTGVLLSVAALGIARLVLPATIPPGVVLLLAPAELIFARLLEVAGQAYMAFERLKRTALLLLGLSLARLAAAAGLMLFFPHPAASAWAALYLGSTIVPAVLAVLLVSRELGAPAWRGSLRGLEARQGLFFSIGFAAQTIYNDIDKAMLARLAGLAPAGLYGAAYRLIDVATSPLGALTASTYSRFFRHGHRGLDAAVRFGRTLLPTTAAYGLLAATALILGAPLLEPVLGRQYAASVTAVRWLAPIVLLRCVHYIGADALTGADRQGLRSAIQAAIAAVNIGLNLWLLPRYSWQGAVASSLVSDGLLAIAIWSSIAVLGRGAATHRADTRPVELVLGETETARTDITESELPRTGLPGPESAAALGPPQSQAAIGVSL